MHRLHRDQAEGLRRLFAPQYLRVVTFCAGASRVGRTLAVVNVAAALARQGRDVLVLDENPAANGVAAALGLKAQLDLEQAIRGDNNLDEVVLRGPAGVLILPAAEGIRSLARLRGPEQDWLLERCGGLGVPVDTLLVDAAAASASSVLSLGLAAQEIVVVVGGSANAITEAYGLVKRLSRDLARRRFHILVNNARNEAEAGTIVANMGRVARRYLQVSLDSLGSVPADEKLRRAARLGVPVVEAFPGAAAAREFRRLAETIAGWPQVEEKGEGFNDFMQCLIHPGQPGAGHAGAEL